MKKKIPQKAAVKKKKVTRKKSAPARSGRILSAGEPPPFRVEKINGRGVGLIICDHASNRVPRSLKDMGLKKNILKKHIAWDIGAEDVSLHVSRMLDMPLVLPHYSRLTADLNRAPQHVECMPEESDHIKIPANAALPKKEKEQRLKEIYWPYQNEIGKLLDRAVSKKQVPILLAIHSFTPEMDGIRRPWHISFMWQREEKLAKQVVREIRKNHPGLLVGENQPYTLSGDRFLGSTIWRHAEERNLPYIFVEFRQDLIDTKEKAVHWADIFLQALRPILDAPSTYVGRKIKTSKKNI